MAQSKEKTKELKIFNNQFIVKKKLSSGSFGVVFLGEDCISKEEVALKIEKEENEESKSLEREATGNQSQILRRLQGLQGIPQLYWTGSEGSYNIMAIELLGRDLAYYIKNQKTFSLKTVLMIGNQLLAILEQLHIRSVVHRDLKPENILVGNKNPQQLYLVDFGISKFYRDNKGNHIPFREGKPFIGTTRYASIAAHKGHELGRFDDLESLAYVLIFMLKGQLPWQNLQNASDKDKTKAVGKMKISLEIQELCKEIPVEFARLLEYVRKMQFKSAPDYKYLQSLIKKMADNNNILLDNQFDWMKEDKNQEIQSKESFYSKSKSPFSVDQSNLKNMQLKLEEQKSPKQRSSLLVPEFQSSGQNSQKKKIIFKQIIRQFDFLRPPDPYAKGRSLIKRTQDRHKSLASLAPSQYSSKVSQNSSIANQYQLSQVNAVDFIDPQQLPSKKHQSMALPQQNFEFQSIEPSEELPRIRTDTVILDMDEEPPNLEERVDQLRQKSVQAIFKTELNEKFSKNQS